MHIFTQAWNAIFGTNLRLLAEVSEKITKHGQGSVKQ
jgi:hypothetical protein